MKQFAVVLTLLLTSVGYEGPVLYDLQLLNDQWVKNVLVIGIEGDSLRMDGLAYHLHELKAMEVSGTDDRWWNTVGGLFGGGCVGCIVWAAQDGGEGMANRLIFSGFDKTSKTGCTLGMISGGAVGYYLGRPTRIDLSDMSLEEQRRQVRKFLNAHHQEEDGLQVEGEGMEL